jgi:hypothetical protein
MPKENSYNDPINAELQQGNKVKLVTGVFNNCGIGVALPNIVAKIEEFARLEQDSHDLPSESEPVFQEYQKIKAHIADFYSIKNDQLTWKRLNNLLNQYTFYEQQLIMGPPIRAYMNEKAPNLTLNQIDNMGRYLSLDENVLNDCLLQPLGISPQFYVRLNDTHNTNEYEEGDDREEWFPLDNNAQCSYKIDAENVVTEIVPPLDIYYKDGHYELFPEAFGQVNQPNDLSEPLKKSFDLLNSGNGVSEGLVCLKKAVLQKFNTSPSPAEEPRIEKPQQPSLQKQDLAKELIERYKQNFFQVREEDKIDISRIDSAEAKQGESDEDFATRLQEAELRKAGYKP